MNTASEIRRYIGKRPRGSTITSGSLQRFGGRGAVDKALSRMVNEGTIRRLKPGIFARPKFNKFIGEVRPSTEAIVRAIASKTGEKIVGHGAEAARRFLLSTQVPILSVFFTSGPTREFMIGALRVRLVHASMRKLVAPSKPEGLALRALWHLGSAGVGGPEVRKVIEKLPPERLKRFLALSKPAWMARAIQNVQSEEVRLNDE